MKGLTLSIIIPNYNSGRLLDYTLASIFSKESSFSFEVLIIDNLSTDNPIQYLSNYSKEAISFYSEADLGIYDAMNKGVALSKGEWLFFIGSGDTIHLESIECAIRDKTDFRGIVYGNVYNSKSNTIIKGDFDLFRLLKVNLCHQAILFSRDVFLKLGFFSLKYPILSDYHFNLKVFFNYRFNRKYEDLVFCDYLGGGISELKKDIVFNKNKNRIIINLLFSNFSFRVFIPVLKYYKKYFLNKMNIIFTRN